MTYVSRRVFDRAGVALFLLPVVLSTAHAQETAVKSARPRQRVYASLYTGVTKAERSDIRIQQPALGTDITYHNAGFSGREFIGSPYYGVKVGTFLPRSPRVGVELEFNHAKMYAKLGEARQVSGTWQNQPINTVEPLSAKVQKYQITNGINSFSFNLLYRVPVSVSEKYPDGRLQPYIGGGPQYSFLYSINIVNSLGVNEKYHPNGWGYQLFGGVRYLLNPRIGLFAEGKYQHGDAVSLVADAGDNEGGRGITDIRMAQLAGGVFYQF